MILEWPASLSCRFCVLSVLSQASPAGNPCAQVGAVTKLGVAVVATFALVWAPFLASPGKAWAVLQRLAPLRRGLYEDYVANFWCATSPAMKWKRLFSQEVTPPFDGLLALSTTGTILEHTHQLCVLHCRSSSVPAWG